MSPIRTALLDAAYDAAITVGWSSARMADVAAAAGVSRQTLYTEFGTKDGLAQALALREAARFVDGSEAELTGSEGTPSEAVGASTAWTLRTAADDPLIKAVLTDDGSDGLLPFLTTRSEALIAAVTERHVAYLRSHWTDLPEGDLQFVADTVVRLTVSHIVTPAGPAEVTARQIAHLVDRLLPGGTPA
ncbi:MAG: TetR family transcriptional regulator [Mycobacteriales bacterium]